MPNSSFQPRAGQGGNWGPTWPGLWEDISHAMWGKHYTLSQGHFAHGRSSVAGKAGPEFPDSKAWWTPEESECSMKAGGKSKLPGTVQGLHCGSRPSLRSTELTDIPSLFSHWLNDPCSLLIIGNGLIQLCSSCSMLPESQWELDSVICWASQWAVWNLKIHCS